MATLNIKTATVETDSGDIKIPAYLAQPVEAGAFPVVVVIQEIFGVNAHIRDVTERVAKEGYVAIAPHIYHRQIPNFEVGYSDEDLVLGRKYKNGTEADELLRDIQGAIAYARTLENAKPGGVGCIGFCFGGHVTYLAATLADVIAAADFYGAGVTTMQPGREQPTLTLTPQISGTLYGFFGTEDPLIPNEQVDQIEAALEQHQIPHKIFRYQGATHGFFCDRRDSYDPQAAADAWEKVKTFFSEKL
ncbi:MAG: dienelactone hydrolase family protein [Leptolyngbya sp. SIO4C5]|nr:dienelactone hydrolase family protein [Leptolyngbya sp. SIO4C5]